MSRADWSFLEHLLDEGQQYSTGVGRVGLTVLLLFRMLVVGGACESAWDDEQSDFVCNTKQPGCTTVCYDHAFPISHFRYFILQIIFVSTPTVFYFGYVAVTVGRGPAAEGAEPEAGPGNGGGAREEGTKEQGAEPTGKAGLTGKAGPPRLRGRLLAAYTCSLVLKVALEAGCMVGLWLLYGGLAVAGRWECESAPCPHTVDCFVSRPTEKTVLTVYTQAAALLSLLLNLLELLHLLRLAAARRDARRPPLAGRGTASSTPVRATWRRGGGASGPAI